jgi:hypothetical protein
MDDCDIADGAEWEGDAGQFVAALMDADFIDRHARALHGWEEYAGKLVRARERNKERMRQARATHVQDTCGARADTCGATVPNSTQQYQEPPPGEGNAEGQPVLHAAIATDATKYPAVRALALWAWGRYGKPLLAGTEPASRLNEIEELCRELDAMSMALDERPFTEAVKDLCVDEYWANQIAQAPSYLSPVITKVLRQAKERHNTRTIAKRDADAKRAAAAPAVAKPVVPPNYWPERVPGPPPLPAHVIAELAAIKEREEKRKQEEATV